MKNKKFTYSLIAAALGMASMSGSLFAKPVSNKAENSVEQTGSKIDEVVSKDPAQAERTAAEAAKAGGAKPPSESQSITASAHDAFITTKVKAVLLATSGVPSHDVKVETNSGVVHLSGDVENKEQIEKAQKAIEDKKIDGVKSIKNDLKVKH
ncbi:periplasmic protein [Candidatus Regiella insecticola LSR1]|uniref:Osmotically-inducible protein Y n=1 Tax=Candidatus Regiella insecticola LSR1 TaxID=663321 RepID=E0WRJ4_9ENTR|nr:BON domain-containing protein [Candidatus Regiella insecticola]EFL92754.1 periplasmic protein [Candidatus Regiella insecticola LSR1]